MRGQRWGSEGRGEGSEVRGEGVRGRSLTASRCGCGRWWQCDSGLPCAISMHSTRPELSSRSTRGTCSPTAPPSRRLGGTGGDMRRCGAPMGHLWGLMGRYEALWGTYGALRGNMRRCGAPIGHLWGLMGRHEALWGTYGALRGDMRRYGAPMGSYGAI